MDTDYDRKIQNDRRATVGLLMTIPLIGLVSLAAGYYVHWTVGALVPALILALYGLNMAAEARTGYGIFR